MLKDKLHTPLRLSTRRADVIVNAFGVEVAETTSQDYALPIIQAVNSHDFMLASLRALLLQTLQSGVVFERDDCVVQARAAIARAEGRADGN